MQANPPPNPYDFTNPQTFFSVKQEESPEIISLDLQLHNDCQLYSVIHSISKDESFSYSLNPDDKDVQKSETKASSVNIDRDYYGHYSIIPNTTYQIQENPSNQININKLYDEMKIHNIRLPPNLIPEILFEKSISFSDIKPQFSKSLFLHIFHRFLVRAIIEICQGDSFLFHRSLIAYLSPQTQIHHDFFYFPANVLIDVINQLFVDKPIDDPQHHDINLSMPNHPELYPFIHFLAVLILNKDISYTSVTKAISVFCPSAISEHIVVNLANTFLTALPTSETFQICRELFGTTFLFGCFRDPSTFCTITQTLDLTLVFPFLYIHGYFMQYFKGKITVGDAIAAVKHIGEKSLFDSKDIVRCFLDPLITNIYKKYILKENDPGYLELTKYQLDAITPELNNALPIFKECIKHNGVALELLQRLRMLLRRHDYLPKGISLTLYSFIYNYGICSPSEFNTWYEMLCSSTKCSSGLLLELNTLINGTIPVGGFSKEFLPPQFDKE